MPMDVSKLIGPQWVFKSETAGEWNVFPYSVKAAIEVEKHDETDDPNPVLRALIKAICKTTTDKGVARSPTETDITAFTEADLNSFAHQFLKEESGTFEDARKEIDQCDAESDAAFLLRLLKAEEKRPRFTLGATISKHVSKLEGLQRSTNSGLRRVGDALASQYKDPAFTSLSERVIAKDHHLSALADMKIPPNPAYKTNDHLEDVASRLEHLVAFGNKALLIMTELQGAAGEFLENFAQEANKNSRTARWAIGVGFAAVFLAILQIVYTEFWRVPRDAAATTAALELMQIEIDQLQEAITSGSTNARSTAEITTEALTAAISESTDGNVEILKNIERLLREQNMQDAALAEAINRLSQTFSVE